MRLAVTAGRQAECVAEGIELFQLAGLQIRGWQRLAGDGVGLRLLALGLLDFCLPNDGRGRPNDRRNGLQRLLLDNIWRSLNSVWCNRRRQRSMQQLHGAVSGVRQICGIGCKSNVGDRQLVGFRQSVLNDLGADGSAVLGKRNTGCIGGIKMAESEPE